MNIVHAQYKNIKLIGGFQFWSNAELSETEQAIPVVLSRPTLVDLIRLVGKYGFDRMIVANANLFHSGELSKAVYQRNKHRLAVIHQAQA